MSTEGQNEETGSGRENLVALSVKLLPELRAELDIITAYVMENSTSGFVRSVLRDTAQVYLRGRDYREFRRRYLLEHGPTLVHPGPDIKASHEVANKLRSSARKVAKDYPGTSEELIELADRIDPTNGRES